MTRRSVYPPSATLTGYALEFTLDSSLQQYAEIPKQKHAGRATENPLCVKFT